SVEIQIVPSVHVQYLYGLLIGAWFPGIPEYCVQQEYRLSPNRTARPPAHRVPVPAAIRQDLYNGSSAGQIAWAFQIQCFLQQGVPSKNPSIAGALSTKR